MGRAKTPKPIRSVSFAGCSWLLTYHLGVGKCFQERLDTSKIKFLGASSGSIAALLMAGGIDGEEAFRFAVELGRDAKKRRWGPVGRMTHYLTTGLNRFVPADAHLTTRGRLKISVTELPFFRNRLYPLNHPQSNDELIQYILASCYIPVYYEKPVFLGGRPCIDGGITDNCPILNADTIRVSPKPRWHKLKVQIGPKEEPPLHHAFIPNLDTMHLYFEKGYEDARIFLEGRENFPTETVKVGTRKS